MGRSERRQKAVTCTEWTPQQSPGLSETIFPPLLTDHMLFVWITKCTVNAWFNTNPSSLNTVSSISTKVSLKKLFSHLEGNRISDTLVLLWNLTVPVTSRPWELPTWNTLYVPQCDVLADSDIQVFNIWFWSTAFTQTHKWDGRSEDPQPPPP